MSLNALVMQLKLQLFTTQHSALVGFNYQYGLSSALYGIIAQGDEVYAKFLHNSGYRTNGRRFKLFTFSDLSVPFQNAGDRMRLKAQDATLTVCFYLPQAAETFVKGLFLHRILEIADFKSKVRFEITGVESEAEPQWSLDSMEPMELVLEPISPIVAGFLDDADRLQYLPPDDERWSERIIDNLAGKYRALQPMDDAAYAALKQRIHIQILPADKPLQQRLITFKAGTPQQTRVKGFTRFKILMNAPQVIVQLALGAGLGKHNAEGMGGVKPASGVLIGSIKSNDNSKW